jgi:hypothetical protein
MKDLILQFFQAKSFPELAAAVRARAAVTLTRWETAVKEVLPTADELTHTQVRNSLPDILENLATALESSKASPTRALLSDSQEHGAVHAELQSHGTADRVRRAAANPDGGDGPAHEA